MSFATLWESLLPIGRDGPSGGYRRFSWTPEDAACRAWFTRAAAERDLRVLTDNTKYQMSLGAYLTCEHGF